MAPDAGQRTPSVAERLRERAPHFAFVQAMWLLHRAYPGAAAPGHQGPATEELVRLRPSVSLAFPPGDLESFEERSTRPPFRLTTTFMGLYGAHSPLPSFYAEEIAKKSVDEDDHAVRAFLDLFNHRILALLYRGIIKFRGHLLYQPGAGDEFSWRLFALAGLAADGLPDATGVQPQRMLRFAGLLSRSPRSAASLQAMLATWFSGLPVRVRQCAARWVYLDQQTQSALGRQGCRLGHDATIGRRVRDWMGKFRVVIGPVDYTTYQSFLPGTRDLESAHKLIRSLTGDFYTHDVQVIVRAAETPQMAISLARKGQLGWTTGLFSKPGEDLPAVFAA